MTANIVARDAVTSTLLEQGEILSRAERDSRFTKYMNFEDLGFHVEQQHQRKQLMYSFGVATHYRGVELLPVNGEEKRRRGRHKKKTMVTDTEANKEEVDMEEVAEEEMDTFHAQPEDQNIEETGSMTTAHEAMQQVMKWEAKLAVQMQQRIQLDVAIAKSEAECAKWTQKLVDEQQLIGGMCFQFSQSASL